MLVEFSVGNFRSFRDVVTLSMVAANLSAKDKTLDENTVFETEGEPRLLTSAAVYGANASGKSNLVRAISFMREFVLNSPKETQPTGAINTEPFRLSAETIAQPSHFEMVFIAGGRRYRYGFMATSQRVEKEWLFHVPHSREARLFERMGDDVQLGEGFKEGRDLMNKTRPNALFLSIVAQFNGKVAQKVLGWFRRLGIASGLEDTGMRMFTQQKLFDGEMRDKIIQFVRRLDLGIHDLKVEHAPIRIDSLPESMPEELKTAFRSLMEHADTKVEDVAIHTVHPQYDRDGHLVAQEVFNLDEQESEGTQKLFALAGPLTHTLKEGQVLIVDELDARLHPLLTREIVGLFNARETNPYHAQLIFTTQDTSLLDNRFLRRDQIWFTEKDRYGTTHLYSLAEFRVRNDASFGRDYVRGRYGAIPFLGDLRQIVEAT